MTEKKLDSFKISETRRPTVGSAGKKAEPELTSESQSLGFKRIEGILEKDDPQAIRANLQKIKDDLAAFEKKSSTAKDKASAKKAAVAVDRTASLMEFLFETKADMQAGKSK